MTHTPATTSTLLIQFVICAHPHQKTSAEQYQFARPSLAKDDTMKQPRVDADQGWLRGLCIACVQELAAIRWSFEAACDKTAATAAEWI
jgi:hypothetical protein